jgi:hypothetical protein
MTTLNDREQQQAATIQARMRAGLAAAEANGDLTREARDRLRARAVLKAKADMAALRQAADSRQASETGRAYKAAFGLRPNRASEDRAYRDGLAANPPTVSKVQELFNQALARGDELAMTALAELAWMNRGEPGGHWLELLERYGGVSPQYDRAIRDLIALTEPNRSQQITDKLQTEIVVPPDLARGSLESMAAEPAAEPPSHVLA